jgi:hypothetical protein
LDTICLTTSLSWAIKTSGAAGADRGGFLSRAAAGDAGRACCSGSTFPHLGHLTFTFLPAIFVSSIFSFAPQSHETIMGI